MKSFIDSENNLDEKYKILIKYITQVNKKEGEAFAKFYNNCNHIKRVEIIKDIETRGCIHIHQMPFGNNLKYEKLNI